MYHDYSTTETQIMSSTKYPPINVINAFRGFSNPRLHHKITPIRFELKNGETHQVGQVRQVHRERVGQSLHYHFVVITKKQRYFHLVFDSAKLEWYLVQEVDEELFFS
jgi:hypothetical protein